MKKIKSLFLLCALMFTLTGCVKFNANMDIKKDKSMDFSIIYAFDTSIFGEESILTDEQKQELVSKGYSVEDYAEGSMKGVTLTKHIKNIDEVSSTEDRDYNLSGILDDESSDNYIFRIKKGLLKNTYTAKFKFDASESNLNGSSESGSLTGGEDLEGNELEENDSEETNETTTTEEKKESVTEATEESEDADTTGDLSNPDLSNMMSGMSNMDLKFNVTLPYAAKSSNATTKNNNNKSLSWNLSSDTAESINFEFELYNMPVIYAGIGVIALLIVLVVAVIIGKKKNKTETDGGNVETVSEVPVAAPEVNGIPAPQPIQPQQPEMNQQANVVSTPEQVIPAGQPEMNQQVSVIPTPEPVPQPVQPEMPQPMNPTPNVIPVVQPTEVPPQQPVQPNLNQPLNTLINGTPQNPEVVPQPMQPQSIVQPPVNNQPVAPNNDIFNGNNNM